MHINVHVKKFLVLLESGYVYKLNFLIDILLKALDVYII